MRISFYTIDDFRLGHDPKGVTGWRLSQFLNWRDALEHYHSLPNDRVKEFGLSNGVQVLQLVRCLPLFPTDRTGYDVLLTDSIVQPLWRNETQALEVAQAAAEHLDVRYCLDGGQIIPAPKPLSERCKTSCEQNIAPVIKQIYAAGVGWLMPEDLRRRYRNAGPDLSLPSGSQVPGGYRDPRWRVRTQEITPWAYKRLEWRAKQAPARIQSKGEVLS